MDETLIKTLFVVGEKRSDTQQVPEYEIISARDLTSSLDAASTLPELYNPETYALHIPVLTDPFHYKEKDQVIPLQPEQLFFMDYTDLPDISGKDILEIGLGSGILSIFCLLKGARHCTGLDINPRAKIFSGHNVLLNNLDHQLEIKDGNTSDIFAPVADRKFGFIYSNPPFEPTPPNMDYYYNSAAGIYGLSFVDALIKDVSHHLEDNGTFQMVTMAPGNEHTPFMLCDILEKYLPGTAVEIILDHVPIRYDTFVDRFENIFHIATESITQMKTTAHADGVTHLHMLVLKYKKGQQGNINIIKARKTYETWNSPLGIPNELYN